MIIVVDSNHVRNWWIDLGTFSFPTDGLNLGWVPVEPPEIQNIYGRL